MEQVTSLHNQFFRHSRPKNLPGHWSYLQATNQTLTKSHIKCQVSVVIISLDMGSPVQESLDAIYCSSNVGIRHLSEFRIPNSCSFVRKYMADRACSQIKSLYFCKRIFFDILQYCFFIMSSQFFLIFSLSYFYNCTKNSKSVSC